MTELTILEGHGPLAEQLGLIVSLTAHCLRPRPGTAALPALRCVQVCIQTAVVRGWKVAAVIVSCMA